MNHYKVKHKINVNPKIRDIAIYVDNLPKKTPTSDYYFSGHYRMTVPIQECTERHLYSIVQGEVLPCLHTWLEKTTNWSKYSYKEIGKKLQGIAQGVFQNYEEDTSKPKIYDPEPRQDVSSYSLRIIMSSEDHIL